MEVDFIPFSLFPYMCKICHFKTCGEMASVRHSNFSSFCLWSPSFFFFLFWLPRGIWKFLGQRSDLSFSCDLCHSCCNTGSLTHCAEREVKPALQRYRQSHCATAGTLSPPLSITNYFTHSAVWLFTGPWTITECDSLMRQKQQHHRHITSALTML